MLGELSALGAAFSFALCGLLIKSQTGRIDAVSLNGMLYAFASLFFFGLILSLGRLEMLLSISLVYLLVIVSTALFSIGLGDTLYVKSLGLIGLSRSFPIAMGGQTFLTSGVAMAFLGEAFFWSFPVGGVLVILGGYLVAVTGKEEATKRSDRLRAESRKGILLALMAPCCWAIGLSTLKFILVHVDVLSTAAIRSPSVAILLLGLSVFRKTFRPRTYGIRPILTVGLAGIIGVGCGLVLLLFAIQQAGAAKTSILISTSPLFALPMAIFILKEPLTRRLVMGTLLCVLGILLVV